MATPSGLIYCGGDWGSAFCITYRHFTLRKLIELIISSLMLLIVLYDLIIRINKQREFNFYIVIYFEMALALIFNIIFDLQHSFNVLEHLEGFIINLYFTTIVYQFSLRFAKKYYSDNRKLLGLVHGIFILFVFFLLVILIINIVIPYQNQIWVLLVNSIEMVLAMILVGVGIKHDTQQKKRIQGIYKSQNIKNPLLGMWIWILINLFSQLCSLIETIVFEVNAEKTARCQFTSNTNVDVIIKFIFALITYHLGMFATVIFFRTKYQNHTLNQETLELGEQKMEVRKIIELTEMNNKQL